MIAFLTISLSRDIFNALKAAAGNSSSNPRLVLDVDYFEDIRSAEDRKANSSPEIVPRSVQVEISSASSVQVEMGTPLNSALKLSLLKSDGSAAATHDLAVVDNKASYAITKADVEAVWDAEPDPVPATSARAVRYAQLVPIGSVHPDFKDSQLSVLALTAQDEPLLGQGGALGAFGFSKDRSSAVEIDAAMSEGLGALPWANVNLGVDGRFMARFELAVAAPADPPTRVLGWVWWFNGARSAAGFVKDDLNLPDRQTRIIPLPAMQPLPGTEPPASNDCDCGPSTPSRDVTETELVNNPNVYSEDPGAFCKPFSNPERVISEKAFAVVARVQQPDISPRPSGRLRTQHLLDLDLDIPVEVSNQIRNKNVLVLQTPTKDALTAALLNFHKPKRYKESAATVEEIGQMPSGRTDMNAEHPLQWEDDIAQYQAVTVALGHILEFRVRTRSNGYSLGSVASTLTLAPRQTKRIQKVEFERLERARRDEITQQADSVSDEVTRERDYNDTVSAYLSEWATGSSSSGTKAAAGGFGFAIPPIVGGVGGGTSSAWSESTQSGTRNTGASEQQRLRDAIRRHGDALRRFQSTVVTEITQQETVTGTTEILRNPNYGHSLTVIYYQILRHLAVSTEFAGVRECLFVPFAMKPFTLQRLYRWREAIQRYLRQPRFLATMKYLRDVITNFEFSNMAPGARSQQKLTYLQGSVYLTLAVERPADAAGAFDAAKWLTIAPFLGLPALGIWSKLAEKVEAQRDQLFQREHAPIIAAKWVNSLQLLASGSDVHADFTLATRYAYNQTVRVDFTVPVSEATKLDRAHLTTMLVKATAALPPGSVAKTTRLSLRYGTANFQRALDSSSGADDILEPGSAVPDPGAQMTFPLDAWDQVDERKTLINSVNELVEHLNEHVEFYHKAVWWSMDRDRLLMMLDGFYVPGTNKVSIASVVDREPVAIIGNSLVYRVGAGTFLGYGKVTTPTELYNTYAGREPAQDPLLISLPTDGLYAQTIMDECLALEEHQGTIDWVLNDPDPDLGTIDPSLMMTRRADANPILTPTAMPATIINLQNAPDAPAPAGLEGALNAVGNAAAFRDMAGLAGTQANAAAALNTASNMATQFGSQAAALKIAELASKSKATDDVNKKLAAVQKAKDQELISKEEAAGHTNKILEEMHTSEGTDSESGTLGTIAQQLLDKGQEGSVAESSGSGMRVVDIKAPEFQAGGTTTPSVITLNSGGTADGRVAIFNFGTFIETNRFKTTASEKGFLDTDVMFNSNPGELVRSKGLRLVEDTGLEPVFTFFPVSKDMWKSTLPSGEKFQDAFKSWVDDALQDPVDCLYLTGHHWAGSEEFFLSSGERNADFVFTSNKSDSNVQIGYGGRHVEFDVAPLKQQCKLIFGFGCDVATAIASKLYQDVFGRGANDVPVVCGWNATLGVPSRSQSDRSPNIRYFQFLEEFANANNAPTAGRLQWLYDNHPMELVRAWGHATQQWHKADARARGKDGKLYKFKLVGGVVTEEATTS